MIKDILKKENLSKEDLLTLIQIENPEDLKLLFDEAYKLKLKYIGNKVYYRGLIECSNICIKNCKYCGIRKDNTNVDRFSLSQNEILDISQWVYENGFGSLALQSGERNDNEFVNFIEDTLIKIQNKCNNSLGITLSLGEQTLETYKRWRNAGASRYLLRIETTNRELFKKIHFDDKLHSFDKRLQALKDLKTAGYQVGTGVMIGLPGQTYEDLVNDIIFFKENDIDMIGMGPYIIHEETPLGKEALGKILSDEERLTLSLKMIALCRLYLKDINIAATTALHALHPFGREKGILAGANVIMPNATSKNIKPKYQLYRGKPNLDDDALKGKLALEKSLKEIGEEVVYFKKGDSPHFFNRIK
ncbi:MULTISPECIES: [FeFe] hydrogenase H-cluster radical SAM maturase HydE [Fusobacterium]|uniref:[FeFe] hydrogenase H-cluster radical SAM maturase HydE n=1 Tax=Fusobacterium TaxID=848 RepID=UPI001476E08C|nr:MULTISPECIES: [FeFe] hydrogenase H-cluster radical SAM maturase HydE [Fusobacterium]NME36774.1 [FeFe] hydrogenase H-cluster radical SAM maturase HydE [Fusobacterium sp. FSA-380-WT-3A]